MATDPKILLRQAFQFSQAGNREGLQRIVNQFGSKELAPFRGGLPDLGALGVKAPWEGRGAGVAPVKPTPEKQITPVQARQGMKSKFSPMELDILARGEHHLKKVGSLEGFPKTVTRGAIPGGMAGTTIDAHKLIKSNIVTQGQNIGRYVFPSVGKATAAHAESTWGPGVGRGGVNPRKQFITSTRSGLSSGMQQELFPEMRDISLNKNYTASGTEIFQEPGRKSHLAQMREAKTGPTKSYTEMFSEQRRVRANQMSLFDVKETSPLEVFQKAHQEGRTVTQADVPQRQFQYNVQKNAPALPKRSPGRALPSPQGFTPILINTSAPTSFGMLGEKGVQPRLAGNQGMNLSAIQKEISGLQAGLSRSGIDVMDRMSETKWNQLDRYVDMHSTYETGELKMQRGRTAAGPDALKPWNKAEQEMVKGFGGKPKGLGSRIMGKVKGAAKAGVVGAAAVADATLGFIPGESGLTTYAADKMYGKQKSGPIGMKKPSVNVPETPAGPVGTTNKTNVSMKSNTPSTKVQTPNISPKQTTQAVSSPILELTPDMEIKSGPRAPTKLQAPSGLADPDRAFGKYRSPKRQLKTYLAKGAADALPAAGPAPWGEARLFDEGHKMRQRSVLTNPLKDLGRKPFIAKDNLERKIYRFFDPETRVNAVAGAGDSLKGANKFLRGMSRSMEGKVGGLGSVAALAMAPLEVATNIGSKVLSSQRVQEAVYAKAQANQVPNTKMVRSAITGAANAGKAAGRSGLGLARLGAKAAKFGARHPLMVGGIALMAGVAGSALDDLDNTSTIGSTGPAVGNAMGGGAMGLAAVAYLSSRDRTNDLRGADLAASMSRPNNPDGPMSFGGGGSTMGGGKNYSMGASGNLTLALNNLRRGR
jgi:hypothetical protein